MILQKAGYKEMQKGGKKVEMYAIFCKCDKCQYTWIFRAKTTDQLPAKCARQKGCPSPWYWNKDGVDKSKEE